MRRASQSSRFFGAGMVLGFFSLDLVVVECAAAQRSTERSCDRVRWDEGIHIQFFWNALATLCLLHAVELMHSLDMFLLPLHAMWWLERSCNGRFGCPLRDIYG